MKKIIEEFKKFITRGNVVDMAVGVLVGSSFTAIVNGLSNFILKPVINLALTTVFGEDALSEFYIFLKKVPMTEEITDEAGVVTEKILEGTVDLANSIYMDIGAFITAVLNFFIVAVILFIIVKIINHIREGNKEMAERILGKKLTKEQKKELKANGIKRTDRSAVNAYFDEKQRKADEEAARKAAEEAAAAAEAARLEREANPTAEDLLKEILAEMKKKNQ